MAVKAPKPTAKTSEKRPKTDWDAIERDYRTGKFTLRELEAKHGVSYAQISRKAKEQAWTKDLRDVIKQATNAALLRESVTKSQKDATETVVVAAEVNKQVILGHRADVRAVRDLAADLLAELSQSKMLADEQELLAEILAGGEDADPIKLANARSAVRKALDVHNRITSVKALAEAFTKVQALERQAFDLDSVPPGEDDALKSLLHGIASGSSSTFKPVANDPERD